MDLLGWDELTHFPNSGGGGCVDGFSTACFFDVSERLGFKAMAHFNAYDYGVQQAKGKQTAT